MIDKDNPSDYIGHTIPTPPPRPGTLPPSAKTAQIVFNGIERLVELIGLPLVILLGMKWGVITVDRGEMIILGSVSMVLGGRMALRRQEGKADVPAT